MGITEPAELAVKLQLEVLRAAAGHASIAISKLVLKLEK